MGVPNPPNPLAPENIMAAVRTTRDNSPLVLFLFFNLLWSKLQSCRLISDYTDAGPERAKSKVREHKRLPPQNKKEYLGFLGSLHISLPDGQKKTALARLPAPGPCN